MIEGYVTAKELAEKWGVTTRTIQVMCSDGRIENAVKFGRDWAIPKDVKKPADGRIVTGKYLDWRKKQGNSGTEKV